MTITKDPKRFEGLRLTENQRTSLIALPMEVREELSDFLTRISGIKFFNPDNNPDPEWMLFGRRTWVAAWEAAWDAAEGAQKAKILSASRNAAANVTGATARDAERRAARVVAAELVQEAVRNAVSNAAKKVMSGTARDLTWAATKIVEINAASDAALYAKCLVVSDLKFPDKEKHLTHAQKCWKAWEKGYAVICDVDGRLYVYSKNEHQPEGAVVRATQAVFAEVSRKLRLLPLLR